MLAIYLAVLSIAYMLAIYYNKTIAREQTKTAKTPAKVDAKNTYKSGSGCGRLRCTEKNANPQRPPPPEFPAKLRR